MMFPELSVPPGSTTSVPVPFTPTSIPPDDTLSAANSPLYTVRFPPPLMIKVPCAAADAREGDLGRLHYGIIDAGGTGIDQRALVELSGRRKSEVPVVVVVVGTVRANPGVVRLGMGLQTERQGGYESPRYQYVLNAEKA